MLLFAAWPTYEAIRRLIHPPPVAGALVLVTALVGVVMNIAAAWCLSMANRSSLDVEGAGIRIRRRGRPGSECAPRVDP